MTRKEKTYEKALAFLIGGAYLTITAAAIGMMITGTALGALFGIAGIVILPGAAILGIGICKTVKPAPRPVLMTRLSAGLGVAVAVIGMRAVYNNMQTQRENPAPVKTSVIIPPQKINGR